jgi:hypothetical protein
VLLTQILELNDPRSKEEIKIRVQRLTQYFAKGKAAKIAWRFSQGTINIKQMF